MGREQKRRLDARKAKQRLQSGQAQRRPMTDAEAESFFKAIDQGEVQEFGIVRLALLELNSFHPAPWCFGESHTTLTDWAAWRGRDSFVSALLTAGADPSHGLADEVWEKLPRAYAAWVARAAARLRRRKPDWTAEAVEVSETTEASSEFLPFCSCGNKASMSFSPCKHPCCDLCPWTEFQNFTFGKLPELLCPSCGISFEDPAIDFMAQRRGIIRSGPLSSSKSCENCGCLNHLEANLCMNCGFSPSEPRRRLPAPKPEVSCWDWLPCWQVVLVYARKAESRQRWESLPEELPDLQEEKGKSGKRAGAFRALSPAEVSLEKLGLSRATRLERLRAAAELGDARRLSCLLDAGADVDAANEYGQSPLFLAAVEGHLDAVEVLLRWGADASQPCHGKATAYEAALARGHKAVCQRLQWETCETCWPGIRKLPAPSFTLHQKFGVALPLPVTHRPLGACYVDDAFDESFLRWLEDLWRTLPQAPFEADSNEPQERRARGRGMDRSRLSTAPRRSYVFDALRIISKQLAGALELCDAPCSCSEAMPQMRFLHYQQSGFLAPHTDLARRDWRTGDRTTHTFILYLSDRTVHEAHVGFGGETVLLQSLKGDELVKVSPIRGRLLVFPHECPHKAMPVEQTKLLLRGEMR
ncbi:Ankyrin repeat domain-containing protein 50 [Durusdinium trenchii]|uniref:Ankyrin repeat domain-containing protein 50 n=1 Tax=Durusdinium trenchii TaxID=1381693 RepID=A0ABP0M1U4_9DINO